MAANSYELYYLIARLTRTEKAYFKKFGFKYQKEEDKTEFVLFDIINLVLKKQSTIDRAFDASVTKKFQTKIKKNIIVVKNSLFQSLVKSLVDYDTAKDSRYKSFINFMEAKTLLKRNINKSASKIAKKANESNQKNEDFLLQILFAEIDMGIGVSTSDKEKIDTANSTSNQMINLLSADAEMKILYEKIYNIHRIHGKSSKKEVVELVEPYKEQLKKLLPKGTEPLKFQFNYFSIGKLIGYIIDDIHFMIYHIEKSVGLIEKYPSFFEERTRSVLASYADLICHGLEANDVKYYDNCLKQFEKIETENVDDRMYKENLQLRIDTTYLLATNQFNKFENIEGILKEQTESLDFNNLIAIYNDFIYAFYCSKNYKKAIQFIHTQFDIVKKQEKRVDLTMGSELLLLAIHYELEDYDILYNLIQSFENRMKESLLYTDDEKIIIQFFKKVSSKEFNKAREFAKKSADMLKANEYSKPNLQFNFKKWFESIAQRKDYADMLN